MSRRLLLIACLCTSVATIAGCATATPETHLRAEATVLDERQQRFAADFHSFMEASLARLPSIPAVSIAVTKSSGPVYLKAFGQADIEADVTATPNTRFYIASSTKSYLALALALMERRGEVDLDWTLAQLAPDAQFPPELRAAEVTLRHLLSHSHGLVAPTLEFRLAYSGQHDQATLWRLLGTLRPNSKVPLGSFDYSNLGYNLAALLLERRLGRSWQQIIEDEVLRPLGARETHARGIDGLRAQKLVAAPYLGTGASGPERLSLLKVDSNMQSAGGLFASGNDLSKWLQLQLLAHKRSSSTAVPADVVAATHAPVVTSDGSFGPFSRAGYGLGWYSGPFAGHTLYHSFGGYSGARSHVSFIPALDLGVAAVSNDEGAGSIFVDVAAVYAYNWFIKGREAAEQEAAPLMDRLVQQAAERSRSIGDDRTRRSTRPWLLSLPRSAYAGRYCNAQWGTIDVDAREDEIFVRMGALNSVATPFTEADAIRVELIPNQGVAIPFTVKEGRVTALRAFDSDFPRCG
jgi:CubicO group peptidase (beta-lactamase class C family)